MEEGAGEDDIDLNIASATRNFDYQEDIWDKKWEGITLEEGKNLKESYPDGLARFKKILEYSAAPGTSRHHWGTDIDINGATPEYFMTPEGVKVYAWLAENAPSFGFCQPYDQKGPDRPTGYHQEKWHWSYLPLARAFTQDYKNIIQKEDIEGFDGDEYGEQVDLIDDIMCSL